MRPEARSEDSRARESPFLGSDLTLQSPSSVNLGPHVAVIMDGNGRWAVARGRTRSEGHRQGAKAVRRVVEAAARLGVSTLTLYAFSRDNWQRPAGEVAHLMGLLRRFLASETRACARNGIRVRVIGSRRRLPEPVVRAIEDCERRTAAARRMTLRIAVDYSAREQIAEAARSVVNGSTQELETALRRLNGSEDRSDAVDLLVRTSGERRLSDFLLWECAYAELHFVDTLWPDFSGKDLEDALRELGRRNRRFGRICEERLAAVGERGTQ